MSLDLKRLQGAALAPALPPGINSFTGNTSTLSWNVTGATSVTIDRGIGAVPLIGSRALSNPNTVIGGTFIFTLTAINEDVTTSASVSITWTGSCIWAQFGYPEWC